MLDMTPLGWLGRNTSIIRFELKKEKKNTFVSVKFVILQTTELTLYLADDIIKLILLFFRETKAW